MTERRLHIRAFVVQQFINEFVRNRSYPRPHALDLFRREGAAHQRTKARMAGDVVVVHDQLPPLVERAGGDPLVREHPVQRLAHPRVAQQRFAVLVSQDLDDPRGRAHDRPLLPQRCERAVNVLPIFDARRIDDAIQFSRLGHVHRPYVPPP